MIAMVFAGSKFAAELSGWPASNLDRVEQTMYIF